MECFGPVVAANYRYAASQQQHNKCQWHLPKRMETELGICFILLFSLGGLMAVVVFCYSSSRNSCGICPDTFSMCSTQFIFLEYQLSVLIRKRCCGEVFAWRQKHAGGARNTLFLRRIRRRTIPCVPPINGTFRPVLRPRLHRIKSQLAEARQKF